MSNGSSWAPPYPNGITLIQQPTITSFELAVSGGEAGRSVLLPLGFDLPVVSYEKEAARRRIGLPLNARVVLSVGSLDISVKRMQWIAQEISPLDNVLLLIAGARHEETPQLVGLLDRHLPGGYRLITADPSQMNWIYSAADVFVLASLRESFGRVIVEALAHGLPTIVHDDPSIRWVGGSTSTAVDMQAAGQLRQAVESALAPEVRTQIDARKQSALDRFSWDTLSSTYVEFFEEAVRRTSRQGEHYE